MNITERKKEYLEFLGIKANEIEEITITSNSKDKEKRKDKGKNKIKLKIKGEILCGQEVN